MYSLPKMYGLNIQCSLCAIIEGSTTGEEAMNCHVDNIATHIIENVKRL